MQHFHRLGMDLFYPYLYPKQKVCMDAPVLLSQLGNGKCRNSQNRFHVAGDTFFEISPVSLDHRQRPLALDNSIFPTSFLLRCSTASFSTVRHALHSQPNNFGVEIVSRERLGGAYDEMLVPLEADVSSLFSTKSPRRRQILSSVQRHKCQSKHKSSTFQYSASTAFTLVEAKPIQWCRLENPLQKCYLEYTSAFHVHSAIRLGCSRRPGRHSEMRLISARHVSAYGMSPNLLDMLI